MDTTVDSDGESDDGEWEFGVGDVVGKPQRGGSDYKIIARLENVDTEDRFYRGEVFGQDFDNPPKVFMTASEMEAEYGVVENVE